MATHFGTTDNLAVNAALDSADADLKAAITAAATRLHEAWAAHRDGDSDLRHLNRRLGQLHDWVADIDLMSANRAARARELSQRPLNPLPGRDIA